MTSSTGVNADEIEYVARFPKQMDVLSQPPHTKTLFVGGVGFGKTKTLGDWVGMEMCNYPDGQGIIASATRPAMKLATIPKVLAELRDRNVWFEYKDYTGECFFANGSWFKFQSLDVAREELEGSELSALAFDEVTGCDEEKVVALMNRVRRMSPCARRHQMAVEYGLPMDGVMTPDDPAFWDYPRHILMCGNPPAPGHWLEEMFLPVEGSGRLAVGNIVQASTYENRLLPKDYIANLERVHIPGSFSHKRMMLGMFGIAAEGAIYDVYSAGVNLVDESQVPTDFKSGLGSIDLGSGGPTGDPFVFLAGVIAKDGSIYITDEYFSTDSLILADHARAIRARYRGGPIFCDYGGRERLELQHLGIRTRPANKDIMMGIHSVRSRFANRRLFIVRGRCPNLLRELPFYTWGPGDKQLAAKGDHALDAMRYIVAGVDLPRNEG